MISLSAGHNPFLSDGEMRMLKSSIVWELRPLGGVTWIDAKPKLNLLISNALRLSKNMRLICVESFPLDLLM